ncbi:MAG TPA: SDR family NAD(P)-dependent oxidoreductase, partial [Phnomibacter sp.]|nr:SDR family NAD(P)-dependent oxidoreductase [Phnomibacter sp.]
MSTVCTLITGAADGLGRSFVHGCAARGHNIIMVAPPGSKLMLLGAHFEKHFGIKCYGIEVDICQNGSIDEICSFLDRHQLDVNVLINNAGIEHLQAFEELSPEFLQTQFAINMICPAMLIHRLLPMLKQTAPSHIINIGSMSCLSASPGPKHYASEKSFLTHLSLSLREELSKYN